MRKAQARTTELEFFEKHHVFPKCVYGDNSYIVKLTPREHYIAHLLLAKARGYKYPKLWLAITRMNKPKVYNSRLYAFARKKTSEWRALKNRTEFNYVKVLPLVRKNNSANQNRPWLNYNAKLENRVFWKQADIVYDLYINKKYPKKQMYSYIGEVIGLPKTKLKVLRNIVKKIREGWVPTQDKKWLELVEKKPNL